MVSPADSAPSLTVILAFDTSNRLAVRRAGTKTGLAFVGADLAMATDRLEAHFKTHTPLRSRFEITHQASTYRVHLTQVQGQPADNEVHFVAIDDLRRDQTALAGSLTAVLDALTPFLIEVPYLHLNDNDFIYKFRPDKERNRSIYGLDTAASALYQSKLCSAIKELARTHERTASSPVALDFGAVQYLIPSHFGFCLGVKNAIERAYESLAENPGKRVFMLSELIHNPYVNEDLLRRGLRYLQSDKGVPYTTNGQKATGAPGETLLWDSLNSEDIVIIPAFGATDDDKRRLVSKGVPIYRYDATCMLVEKVWKAARNLGREGYTVVIHGKHEHEETKATFSNAKRYAPAVIVRNMDEARKLGLIISSSDPAVRATFYQIFANKHTPGFDVDRDLQRIAVVNQTTLLMNETLEIVDYLRQVYRDRYGETDGAVRVGGSAKGDTLCYATQVNQDALGKALDEHLDAAFVIGGKNSSNTYQLYRLCEQRLGKRAFFIQSEANIRSRDEIEHHVFPAHGSAGGRHHDVVETHPLPAGGKPYRVLLTGGASCPDGIIQQVITRINSLFPAEQLRPIDDVLGDLVAIQEKN
ncbi:MAG TPA: 4-hydroxy-3-methylbut-2-enyl diphosphate reductase [Opitutaceae bacterium]|nr:4-hydroxy-3-methylbut-2-enyl diphosphate reductase [Opitutaceae bacterium]